MDNNVSSLEEHRAKRFLDALATLPFVAFVWTDDGVQIFHPHGMNPNVVRSLQRHVRTLGNEQEVV